MRETGTGITTGLVSTKVAESQNSHATKFVSIIFTFVFVVVVAASVSRGKLEANHSRDYHACSRAASLPNVPSTSPKHSSPIRQTSKKASGHVRKREVHVSTNSGCRKGEKLGAFGERVRGAVALIRTST